MDGRIPEANECITRELLHRNAKNSPDHIVLLFDSGEAFSNAALLNKVQQQAASLQAVGVSQGDYVLSWLPNCPNSVLLLLSLNYIGAIYVPVNTAYKGGILEHVISSSKARLMIADSRLLESLENIQTGKLKKIIAIGETNRTINNISLLKEAALRNSSAKLRPLNQPLKCTDTHVVIFTSGTTGPSKGVMCSYIHTWTTAVEFRHIGPEDRSLVTLPMFHIGGVLGTFFALIHCGSSAFVKIFSTSKFWQTVNEMQVTTVGLLGAMVQFLMKQPAQENEQQHSIKTAVIAPLGDDALAFAKRFNVDIYTEFNMTEISVPLFCGPNPTVRGTCGTPRKGVELKLIDAKGNPVNENETGELLVKVPNPFAISHGYLNNPSATAAAFKDGWFHTGDLFYCDSEQNYFFVDRAKDMIRRRGENISSFEVELELIAHPSIYEAAAVAVPGDGGEDEVMTVITFVKGQQLSYEDIITFLEPRMAYFMIPRYIRILDELPKTPTQKIEKHLLRDQGITRDSWDREKSAIKLQRLKLK